MLPAFSPFLLVTATALLIGFSDKCAQRQVCQDCPKDEMCFMILLSKLCSFHTCTHTSVSDDTTIEGATIACQHHEEYSITLHSPFAHKCPR